MDRTYLFSITGSTSIRVSSSSLSRTMLNKEIEPESNIMFRIAQLIAFCSTWHKAIKENYHRLIYIIG